MYIFTAVYALHMSYSLWLVGCCVEQSDGCGKERSAVALLPALRIPQSGAEGAAQGLQSAVVKRNKTFFFFSPLICFFVNIQLVCQRL